jgi:hypothetical protein
MHSLALSYVCLLRDLFYIPILMTRQSIWIIINTLMDIYTS